MDTELDGVRLEIWDQLFDLGMSVASTEFSLDPHDLCIFVIHGPDLSATPNGPNSTKFKVSRMLEPSSVPQTPTQRTRSEMKLRSGAVCRKSMQNACPYLLLM